MIDIEELKVCYKEYTDNKKYYTKIDKYYYGNTDVQPKKSDIPGASNQMVHVNYVQKLVDEEAQYSFGNKVTYKAIEEEQKDIIDELSYHFKNSGATYMEQAGKELIKFLLGYELCYRDKNLKFKTKWITPLEGNHFVDEYGDMKFFMYVHHKKHTNEYGKVELVPYLDVYDNTNVYYYDAEFNEISPSIPHNMGQIPVGVAMVDNVRYTNENGYIQGDKSIFRNIKTLQDGIERNFSDMVQEITDFHNAIMVIENVEDEYETDADGDIVLDDNNMPILKRPLDMSTKILKLNAGDSGQAKAYWLEKNINDTFVKNTRDDLVQKIYEITSHIDGTKEVNSNVSGVALRSTLRQLEAKCKANECAMEDVIRTRISCLLHYLKLVKLDRFGKPKDFSEYDANLISIEFTPCVPQSMSEIIQICKDVSDEIISKETKRSLFPFVNNPEAEGRRVEKEQSSMSLQDFREPNMFAGLEEDDIDNDIDNDIDDMDDTNDME